MNYDESNIFWKIINKQVHADIIYEDEYAVALNDINPSAPIHILVLPKEKCISFTDFAENASGEYFYNFFCSVNPNCT